MTQDAEFGRRRVAIEAITPQVDCGRWPIKRVQGDRITVEADLFADGHEEIRGALLYRHENSPDWSQAQMELFFNDRWRATFVVREIGRYFYTVRGWVDRFQTWRHDLAKRVAAGMGIEVDLEIGAGIVAEAAARAINDDRQRLTEFAGVLEGSGANPKTLSERAQLADSPALVGLMDRYPNLQFATTVDPPLAVTVDRPRARFSAWYEMFPRCDELRRWTARHVRRRRSAIALCRRDGIRCALFPADSSDRHGVSQRKEQLARGAAGRRRQPVGDRGD